MQYFQNINYNKHIIKNSFKAINAFLDIVKTNYKC